MGQARPVSNAPSHLLAGLLACSIGTGCGGGGTVEERPPDVLLIVVDTLRADALGCYGGEPGASPAIDRLAREGVRFAHAVSQAPWTTPSIGALMTSEYPTTLGIITERSPLPDEVETLAEFLRARGYRTGAVVSHSFCSSRWGFDQGFDVFDESNVIGPQGVTSPGVTAKALEFLEVESDRPYFLWLHYFDPHDAFLAHPGHEFPGPEGYEGPVVSGLKLPKLLRLDLEEPDLETLRSFYKSEVSFTDHHVGRVLEHLRAKGRLEDTLVVFTADHGEEFHDHGALGHQHTLYEELVHVPLIVRAPGRAPERARGTVERTVASIDVYPTVLDVLGFEPSRPLEGRSLFGPDEPRLVFSETSKRLHVRAVVSDRMKLVGHLGDRTIELFELGSDPGETRDLSAERPEEAARLRRALEEWTAEVRRKRYRGAELELSPEEAGHLQELGYVDD